MMSAILNPLLWTRWKGHGVALLAGALLPLSFAPFHYYPVAVLSLALLFLCWSDVGEKQAALRGFLFGFGFFAVGISWVYVAIHDFGGANIFLATFMTTLFVSFLASYIAVLAWGLKKISARSVNTSDLVLLFPVLWLVYEWFKSWFLTGLPWLEIGGGQIDGPLSGFTPVIGVLGVSLLTAISAGLVAVIWLKKQRWPLFVFFVIWAGGYQLKSASWTTEMDDEFQVSIIQGNIPQVTKWDPEQLLKSLALYQTKTEQHWDSDLIVWPENAITMLHHRVKEGFLDPLEKQAQAHKTDVIVGLPVFDQETGHYHNSVVSLGQRNEFYYKSHLVPFGDYIPFEWLRGLIAFFDLPMSVFLPGPVRDELMEVAGQKIGMSICYEDAFSTEVLRSLPEASVLVNVTNNAWYGDSFAPHQHLQISQNRALEVGRPIIRATTNGISALINFDGQVAQQTPQFEEAVLTAKVQPRKGMTPYVYWGLYPVWLLSLVMLLVWEYYRRRNRISSID